MNTLTIVKAFCTKRTKSIQDQKILLSNNSCINITKHLAKIIISLKKLQNKNFS